MRVNFQRHSELPSINSLIFSLSLSNSFNFCVKYVSNSLNADKSTRNITEQNIQNSIKKEDKLPIIPKINMERKNSEKIINTDNINDKTIEYRNEQNQTNEDYFEFNNKICKEIILNIFFLLYHIDRNILEKILYILERAPEHSPISVYNPNNGDYTDAFAKGRHVISTKTNFWLQACIYPNDLAKEFVEVSNQMTDDQTRYDDSRLKAYLQYKNIFKN